MIAPVHRAARMAAATGQPLLTHRTPVTVEARPLTEPTDRSISPTISTQTTPRAITPTVEQSKSRLTRLLLERKTGFRYWKMDQMMISPTIAGSEPRSPVRTGFQNARSGPATPCSCFRRMSWRSSGILERFSLMNGVARFNRLSTGGTPCHGIVRGAGNGGDQLLVGCFGKEDAVVAA